MSNLPISFSLSRMWVALVVTFSISISTFAEDILPREESEPFIFRYNLRWEIPVLVFRPFSEDWVATEQSPDLRDWCAIMHSKVIGRPWVLIQDVTETKTAQKFYRLNAEGMNPSHMHNKWKSHDIAKYRYSCKWISDHGTAPPELEYLGLGGAIFDPTVEVNDGHKVVLAFHEESSMPDLERVPTIDDLFEVLVKADQINDYDQILMHCKYNEEYGYPEYVYILLQPFGFFSSQYVLLFELTQFEVLM